MVKLLKQLFSEVIAQESDGGSGAPSPAQSDDDDDDDLFSSGRKKRSTRAATEGPTAKATDIIAEEVERFFQNNYIDWQKVIREKTGDKDLASSIGTTPESMAKNWELIAKHFDPLEYWHTLGLVGNNSHTSTLLLVCIWPCRTAMDTKKGPSALLHGLMGSSTTGSMMLLWR